MRKIILTFLVIAFTISNSYSQISGATALIALDEIDKSITSQMNSVDNLITNSIGNTGNMILSVSARLKKDINETIGNTDKKLRENQLNLYNQISTLSTDFNKAINENIQELDVISARVTQTVDDFFGKNKEPNIFKYKTGVFISNYDKDYKVSATGKNFDRSYEVYVNLYGKKLMPVSSINTKIEFVVDSTLINSNVDDKGYLTGEIVFKWKQGLFNRKKERRDKFIIPVAPLEIGTAQAFYEQELPKKIYYTQEKTYNCSTGSSNWKGEQEKESTAINIIPVNGRYFDKNSIQVTNWYQRHGGGYSFTSKTEQQFVGKITCKSDGKPYGGGGKSTLTFKYKEYEIKYMVENLNTDTLNISTVNPILFELPEPIDGKRPNLSYVRVMTFDNKEIILTPNETNKYFSVKINPVTDDVTVNWKK
jgi:hypothetical protein